MRGKSSQEKGRKEIVFREKHLKNLHRLQFAAALRANFRPERKNIKGEQRQDSEKRKIERRWISQGLP